MEIIKGKELSKIKQKTPVIVDVNDSITTIAIFHEYDEENNCAVVIDTYIKVDDKFYPSFANYGKVVIPNLDVTFEEINS